MNRRARNKGTRSGVRSGVDVQSGVEVPSGPGLRGTVAVAGALAVLAVLVFGRGSVGSWFRQMAERRASVGALSDALVWLDRADRVDAHDPDTELIRARCFRQLGEFPLREQALTRARNNGASPQRLRDEVSLGEIQSGAIPGDAIRKLQELIDAGLSPHDVSSCFIQGLIARKNLQLADVILQAWTKDYPEHPQTYYMRGVLQSASGDADSARKSIQKALALAPQHEPAQLALAWHYGAEHQTGQALDLFTSLARRHPENPRILMGMARSLHELGRLREARAVLAFLASEREVTSDVISEIGQIELELGHYEDAKRWFDQVKPPVIARLGTMTAAGTTLALLGDTMSAQRTFDWIADTVVTEIVSEDLQKLLAVHPDDQAAARDLQTIRAHMATRQPDENPYSEALTDAAPSQSAQSPGRQLYAEHCSACHGAEGEGDGRAARHVFPRPRNLLVEPMRLVSTRNGIPTRDDVRHVIRAGIPGTSMIPMESLQDSEIDQLVDVVMEMRQQGIRRQYVELLQQDGERIDDDDVADVVASRTTPGAVVSVPDIPATGSPSSGQGEEIYVQQACHSCHGKTGTGDDQTPLFDDLGRPAFPRDLVHDLFKGGNTAESIYLRILLGMPGSPHPANVNLSQDELIELVQYCLLLGEEPKRRLTNHERAIQASSRPAVEFFASP